MRRGASLGALALALLCGAAVAGAVNAPGPLDRQQPWSLHAAPLARALLEFSSQSGVQTAADGTLVSGFRSNAVDGTLSVRAALTQLLAGTQLTFEPVGASTVVIRRLATVPLEAVRTSHGQSVARADARTVDARTDAASLAELTVAAARPVLDRKTAQEGLYSFIVHHSTVHYVNMGGAGNLARWRGGRAQTVCPRTLGLDAAASDFVTNRVRELARGVGAPVDDSGQCKENVRFVFTDQPQAVMDQVTAWAAARMPRYRYAPVNRLQAYDPGHAIQGWYLTTSGGDRVLNQDFTLLPLHLLPVWPHIMPKAQKDTGDESGIAGVIFLVDSGKIADVSIGAVADYLAVLTLTLSQSPDHCDALPSILDLRAASCTSRPAPQEATPADLAFLRALYYRNTGLGASPSRSDIEGHMLDELTQGTATP